jgi:hypothetical protein
VLDNEETLRALCAILENCFKDSDVTLPAAPAWFTPIPQDAMAGEDGKVSAVVRKLLLLWSWLQQHGGIGGIHDLIGRLSSRVEEAFRRAGEGGDVPISWPETLTSAIRRVFFVSGAYRRDRMPILMGMLLSDRRNKILLRMFCVLLALHGPDVLPQLFLAWQKIHQEGGSSWIRKSSTMDFSLFYLLEGDWMTLAFTIDLLTATVVAQKSGSDEAVSQCLPDLLQTQSAGKQTLIYVLLSQTIYLWKKDTETEEEAEANRKRAIALLCRFVTFLQAVEGKYAGALSKWLTVKDEIWGWTVGNLARNYLDQALEKKDVELVCPLLVTALLVSALKRDEVLTLLWGASDAPTVEVIMKRVEKLEANRPPAIAAAAPASGGGADKDDKS